MRNIKFNLASSAFIRVSKIFQSSNFAVSKSSFTNTLETPIHISSKGEKVERKRKVFQKTDLEIKDTVFGNCRSITDVYNGGGAIYTESSTLNMIRTIFVDNYAKSSGGAIRIERTTNCNLTHCFFGRNVAGSIGGAALFSVVFEVNIQDSNFTSNLCEETGASIALMMCESSTVYRCVDHNSQAFYGSSLVSNNGELEVGVCSFIREQCKSISGIMHATAGIFSTSFFDSRPSYIYWESCFQLTVQECTFDTYKASSIQYNKEKMEEQPTIEGCTFNLNIKKEILEDAIPKSEYNFANKKMKVEKHIDISGKKFSDTYIDIQNIPAEDTFDNNPKKTFSLVQYIITYVLSFFVTLLIHYQTRIRNSASRRGVLGQIVAGANIQEEVKTEQNDLNNEQLFEPVGEA